jgi:hypothetical protein
MEKSLSNLSLLMEDALPLLLLAGSLLALLVGLLFLLAPATAVRLNHRLNRWISLRRGIKSMESPHFIERFLYRHHRSFGIVILLSSCYVLYRFGFHYDQQVMLAGITKLTSHRWLADWLLTALLWFMLPAMLIAIMIGAVFAVRPSLLKGFEAIANRWISTRKWLQPIETTHYPLDRWVTLHPRLFGAVTASLAAYLSILSLLLVAKPPQ